MAVLIGEENGWYTIGFFTEGAHLSKAKHNYGKPQRHREHIKHSIIFITLFSVNVCFAISLGYVVAQKGGFAARTKNPITQCSLSV